MTEWMRLHNEMKRRPMEKYLTPTQKQARNKTCELLRFPNRINLFGPYGSGKTYVAWAIVRATGATHVPVPEKLHDLDPGQDILLIDNAAHYEADVRRILASANLLGASSVVVITRESVGMPMHRIFLPLPTGSEIEVVLRNYSRLGFYEQHDLPSNPNFWNIMLSCV